MRHRLRHSSSRRAPQSLNSRCHSAMHSGQSQFRNPMRSRWHEIILSLSPAVISIPVRHSDRRFARCRSIGHDDMPREARGASGRIRSAQVRYRRLDKFSRVPQLEIGKFADRERSDDPLWVDRRGCVGDGHFLGNPDISFIQSVLLSFGCFWLYAGRSAS